MSNWMAALAAHYQAMRQQYPTDRLLIIFDIDGTILDLRHMMLYLLRRYDREHGANHFHGLTLEQIDVHENVIDLFLQRFGLDEAARAEIEAWYLTHYWSPATIAASHHAFAGVFDIIRWLQLQPNTFVGLNTGRFEVLRSATLESLNKLGRPHGVTFTDDLLILRPNEWTAGVAEYKVVGMQQLQAAGYRIIAFIDNEPNNLALIDAADPTAEILLLHADTIFLAPLELLPARTIQGDRYTVTDFVTEAMLPPQVDLVWHGVNDEANLQQFLTAAVPWAELDVNLDPTGAALILRHDTFAERGQQGTERWLDLDTTLATLSAHGRAVKLDFKVKGQTIDAVLERVDHYRFRPAQLWFNGNLDILTPERCAMLATRYPGAIIQAPVGHLRTLINQPKTLHGEIEKLAAQGLTRFSLKWQHLETRRFCAFLQEWGYEVNLYGVTDLETFLQAVLLTPTSVTSDFNFPEWGYYGRGAGQQGVYYDFGHPRARLAAD